MERKKAAPEPWQQYAGVRRLEDLPPYLVPQEVATTLRKPLSTVYESIRSGWLRPIAIHWGTRILIPRDALIERLKEGGEL